MVDSTWVAQQSEPDRLLFGVGFTMLVHKQHSKLASPTSFDMFVSVHSFLCLSHLPAHRWLIALSVTRHTSAFLSVQLNDIYLKSEYPIALSCAQQSDRGLSPNRVGSIIAVCKRNPSFHLFVSTHSCLF